MKHALILLIALIGLCSLTGCGAPRQATLAPPPLILSLPDCPTPEAPRLPRINGSLPFDAPANVKILLERDDILRAYIKGLNATVQCFRRTTAKKEPQ